MATAAVSRIKKKLPDRLAQVRGDRSQRQFARDLGVFQQNVNRYENGTTPHTDFLITLATKESVSLDWLLLGKAQTKQVSCMVGKTGRMGRPRRLPTCWLSIYSLGFSD